MASIPQGFAPHPGGMQQPHPGVPQGHHMAPGMAHNPSQPGAQPGGIPPHLAQQMGVSAPGGQVNPSALMGVPGAPNVHAMQHLNPQMFGQQPGQMNCESRSYHASAPRAQKDHLLKRSSNSRGPAHATAETAGNTSTKTAPSHDGAGTAYGLQSERRHAHGR